MNKYLRSSHPKQFSFAAPEPEEMNEISLTSISRQAVCPAPDDQNKNMAKESNTNGSGNKMAEKVKDNGSRFGSEASLFRAVRQGYLKGIEENCKQMSKYRKETINDQDEFGMTALHHAIRSNKMEVVTTLLDMGADINARSSQSSTPLIAAVM